VVISDPFLPNASVAERIAFFEGTNMPVAPPLPLDD